jgi:hypothetical protein
MQACRKLTFHPLLHAGLTRRTEAQLWNFIGPSCILKDDHAPVALWVAAESLDAERCSTCDGDTTIS